MSTASVSTPYQLKKIAKIVLGSSPDSRNCNESGVGLPFLQGNAEFTDLHPKNRLFCSAPTRVCERGDVLLSVRAPVGAANLADQAYAIGRGLAAIRFPGESSGFGWHAVRYWSSQLERVAQGSTFTAVGRRELEEMAVVSFPPVEQSRIAEILDTLDAAIRESERVVDKLRQVKSGLLHDLLTRGLDDNGELRDPVRHPGQFQDSPLGQIPRLWTACPLGELLHSSEYGISDALRDTGTTPILRMNNLFEGEADLTDLKFADCRVPDHLLLKTGDVLFNRTNSFEHVGRTGIWRGQLAAAGFASYLVRLNPKPARLTAEFLNLLLNRPENQIAMRRFATPGVHQVNINPTNLKRLEIAAPVRTDEQERIVSRRQSLSEIQKAHERELEKLRALKHGLSHDLLTGRVRVRV